MSRVTWFVLAAIGVIGGIVGITALGVIESSTATRLLMGVQALIFMALGVGAGRPEIQGWGPVLLRGPSGTRSLALTFDDGPVPETLPALLAALAEAGATATFFLLLDRAEQHPDLVRQIGEHHEIGLHGVEHSSRLVFKSPLPAGEELRAAAERLSELSGRPVRFYRPPFGATSPRLYDAVKHAGLEMTWCSRRTWDGGPTTARAIRERVGKAQAGDIVLLHDGRPITAELLPVILQDLADRQLLCVGLSTLVSHEDGA